MHGKLSPAEFEVMEVIWEHGEDLTISQVLEHVNAARRDDPLKRATIQVQLRRLEDKGWLSHREEGRRFLYRATAKREAASAGLATDLAARVFDGSCAELVRCLFETQEVSAEEIARIRALLDEAENASGAASRRTTESEQ